MFKNQRNLKKLYSDFAPNSTQIESSKNIVIIKSFAVMYSYERRRDSGFFSISSFLPLYYSPPAMNSRLFPREK